VTFYEMVHVLAGTAAAIVSVVLVGTAAAIVSVVLAVFPVWQSAAPRKTLMSTASASPPEPLQDRHLSYRTNVRPEARLPAVAPRTKWWRLAGWVFRGGPVRLWWWRRHEWVDEIGHWLPCWTRVRVPKSDHRTKAFKRRPRGPCHLCGADAGELCDAGCRS
jgi:hypothetical protein